MSKSELKVIVSGGHLTAAIPLVERIIESGGEVVYLGRDYASVENQTKSMEEIKMTELGVEFYSVNSPKLDAHKLTSSLLRIPKVRKTVNQIRTLIRSSRPNVVVSFGGYLGLPLVLAAKLEGLPVLIHEQTGTLGWANYLSRPFANKVALGDSRLFNRLKLWRGKTLVTGNPLRSEFLNGIVTRPEGMPESLDKPLIFVTGGSQGSFAINRAIFLGLNKLLDNYCLVHLTGDSKSVRSWEQALEARDSLVDSLKQRYFPFKWLDSAEFNWSLSNSKIIISRGGANTVNEIMWVGTPAVLIPLPLAHGNEQEINTQRIVAAGAGVLLKQDKLSAESLIDGINRVEMDYNSMKESAVKLKSEVIADADLRLYAEVMDLGVGRRT